jgi:RNase P subunit RPR2
MSLFKEFSVLFPYLQSVRRLENYIAFDISFPKTWKLPKKYVEEDKVIEQESKIDLERLFTFVSEINENDVEKLTKNIQSLITFNLEREEKEKLFENKVEELKQIFEKTTLKNLQTLKFEIKNIKSSLTEDEVGIKIDKLVGKREVEGPSRN